MKRPLTQEEIAAADAAGYDMSGYDGKPVDLPDDLYGAQAKSSALGAGAKTFAASAAPTAAGGAVFMPAFTSATGLAAPLGPYAPIAGVIAGLAASYGASKLTAAAQHAIIPKEWEESVATAQREYPTAAKVGQLAALPFGGFRPSPTMIRRAATGAGKLGAEAVGTVANRGAGTLGKFGSTLTAEEAQALKLTAGGAALGAGQEAVVAPLEGREVTLPHLFEAAATGGAFTHPTTFAQRFYKFPAPLNRTVTDPTRLAATLTEGEPTATAIPTPKLATVVPPAEPKPAPAAKPIDPVLDIIQKRDKARQLFTALGDNPAQAADKAKIGNLLEEIDAQIAADPRIKERVETVDRFRSEDAKAKAKREAEGRDAPEEEPILSNEPSLGSSPLAQWVRNKMITAGIPLKTTKEYIQSLVSDVITNWNIHVSANGGLVNDKNIPIRGTALLPDPVRQIVYNPEFATADVPAGHEVTHYIREETERAEAAGNKQAAELRKLTDELSRPGFEADQARRKEAGLEPHRDLHEFIAKEQGFEFLKQQLNLAGETKRQKWWNDLRAVLKTKWSKQATVEDLRRALNFELVHKGSMGKYVGKEGPLGPVAGGRSVSGAPSEVREERSASEEDIARYKEVQAKMLNLMRTNPDSPELTQLFKENEQIKNKYGGMPPTAERNALEEGDINKLKKQPHEGRYLYKPFSEKEIAKGEKFKAADMDNRYVDSVSDILDQVMSDPDNEMTPKQIVDKAWKAIDNIEAHRIARNAPDEPVPPKQHDISKLYHKKALDTQLAYMEEHNKVREDGLAVFRGIDDKVEQMFAAAGPNRFAAVQMIRGVIEGYDNRPDIVKWVADNVYGGEEGKMLRDMVAVKDYNAYLSRLKDMSVKHVTTQIALGRRDVERNAPEEQPIGEPTGQLKSYLVAKLTTQAEAAEKAGNTDIAKELRLAIADVQKLGQPERLAPIKPGLWHEEKPGLYQESQAEAIRRATSTPKEGQEQTKLMKSAKTSSDNIEKARESGEVVTSRQDTDLLDLIARRNQHIKERSAEEEQHIGEPTGAERQLIEAAKRTRPYLEWVNREAASGRDRTDAAFYKALMTNDLLRDDIMTEPNVMAALKGVTELPAPKPEAPVPKTAAVEKVVEGITKPDPKAPAVNKVISPETGQEVEPLKTKESIILPKDIESSKPEAQMSIEELRAEGDRLRKLLEKAQAKTAGKFEEARKRATIDADILIKQQMETQARIDKHQRKTRTRPVYTSPEQSKKSVEEEAARYLEERRKKGRFAEEEELSPYMKESQALHKQVEALEVESRKHEEKINEFYTKSGLGDKIESLATKMYGVPEKDSGWTGQDELEMALHNLFRPYDVENAELNMGLSMPGLKTEGVSEHAQRVWGKVKAKFPNEASDIETLYQQMRNLSSYKDNQIISKKQLAIFKEIGNLWKKHDNRYAEEEGPVKTGEQTDPDIRHATDESPQAFIPGLAATFNKIKRLDIELAQAGVDWQARKESYWGKAQTAIRALAATPSSVLDRAIAKMQTGAALSPAEDKAALPWRQYFKWNADERAAIGMKPTPTYDPNYVPQILNRKWTNILVNKPESPEAQNGKALWANRVVAKSGGKILYGDAYNNITDYIGAIGSPSTNYKSVNFRAIRNAVQYPLPEGMRENSAREILARFGRRSAADMALYRELESQPSIQQKLGLNDPVTGKKPRVAPGETDFSVTKEVQNMMAFVTGAIDESAIRHPVFTSITRLANNLLLGPGTGLRDAASIPVFAVPYLNKFSDLAAFVIGITKVRENAAAALDTAAVQPHLDRVMMSDIADSPSRFLDLIRKAATLARTGQGREAIENFNREVVFSIGKELARNNIAGAKAGHKGSKQYLDRFNTLVEGDPTKLTGKDLDTALNQMAKNFVDANQGTYGGSGLPAGVVRGPLAPFLALQKWSIEKSNTIFKDVVKPFYTGENRIPMLTYFLGSVLTGAAIQALNKLLTNKTASDPTWKEALDKGDATAIVSQIATLMQLASYGGIVGDTAKLASDTLKGKTPRNPLSFPAFSSSVDAAESIKNAAAAINDGEPATAVLTELATYLMKHNIQATRMAAGYVDKEETERSQKFRDIRVFKELEHEPFSTVVEPNRFEGLTSRQFKRTGDIGEAVRLLPELTQRAMKSGNYEDMSKKFRALKGNSYQTFPSLESTPMEFQKYYSFLLRTQGKEVADARLQNYMQQRLVNQIKSSMIPSF